MEFQIKGGVCLLISAIVVLLSQCLEKVILMEFIKGNLNSGGIAEIMWEKWIDNTENTVSKYNSNLLGKH